ncbi:centromere protein Q isoform X2 [Vanacampus margaritifer]
MKPVRGSNREASKVATDNPDSPSADDNHDKTTHHTSPKKRKASEIAPKDSKKLKPIRRSSIIALENIMNMEIVTTLALRRSEMKENRDHLNIVKNRFLSHCEQLQVPVQKHEELGQSWQRHQKESKKCEAAKQTLSCLEEDLKAAVGALESTEEQMASLQRACSSLREQLEEEEEKAKEMLQRPKQAVLNLPSHPPRKDERSLETNCQVLNSIDGVIC